MKLIILLSLLSLSAIAQDMSKTENWDAAYREESDGSTTYIGGCALHQEYENKMFTVGPTIIKYFEPSQFTQPQIMGKLAKADPALIAVMKKSFDGSLEGVDDLTLEKLHSQKFPKLDLYRANIGVGGGNGIYLVYHKLSSGKYELLSQVMDGDVEFCDKKVWLK